MDEEVRKRTRKREEVREMEGGRMGGGGAGCVQSIGSESLGNRDLEGRCYRQADPHLCHGPCPS